MRHPLWSEAQHDALSHAGKQEQSNAPVLTGCVWSRNLRSSRISETITLPAYVPLKHLKCPNMMQPLATNMKWKIMHKYEQKFYLAWTLRDEGIFKVWIWKATRKYNWSPSDEMFITQTTYSMHFKRYKVVQIWPGLICVYVSTNQSRSYLNHLVHGKTAKLWLGDLPAGSFQVRNSHAAHFCYSFTVWIYRWSSVLLFSSEFRFCYRTAVSYICVM